MVTALSVTHGFTTTSWSSSYSKRIKSEYWTCVTIWDYYCYSSDTHCRSDFNICTKLIPSAYTREGIFQHLVQKEFKASEMPSFGLSILTAVLPVILMLLSTVVQLVTGHETAKICLNKSFTLSVQQVQRC